MLFGALSTVVLFAAVDRAKAVDDPAKLIEYRQSVMRANGGHLGAIVAVAKGEVSFTDEVAGHAEAIHMISLNLARLFPEGSGREAGDTRALPAIWERWGEFEAAIARLRDESAKLAEVA